MYIYRIAHYGQPTVHLRRYSLRLDGFVSVNAPYAGGELLTKPFTFTGSELELNYETSAFGGVRVEVQDESRRAIPGYALDDCPEFFGDRRIEGVVSWEKEQTSARWRVGQSDCDSSSKTPTCTHSASGEVNAKLVQAKGLSSLRTGRTGSMYGPNGN